MNRAELRQKVLDLASWHADVDTDFVAEFNRSVVDVAYKRLASEVPEALEPDTEVAFLFSDRTHTSMGRLLNPTTDDYVLSLGLDTLPNATAPAIDGTWDGQMHVEVTRASGQVLRFRCREFWLEATGAYKDHYLVSLERPYPFPADASLTFRFHQPHFFTRDDVTRVLDARVYDSNRTLLTVLPEKFIHLTGLSDYQGNLTGTPGHLHRSSRWKIIAPSLAPAAVLDGKEGQWSTTMEPPGTFTYRYTYVWGKRPEEWLAPGGVNDPVWESAPSPASAAVTIPTLPSDAVVLTLVNVDWTINFDPSPAEVRNDRSGLRKRIYRARTAQYDGVNNVDDIEYDGVYYLLAEVSGTDIAYVDDGTTIPDRERRLPESHGYWCWVTVPHPDQDYELDLRVLRRPQSLSSDADVPSINPEFEPMFLELCLHYLHKMDRKPQEATEAEARYRDMVNGFRAMATNPADFIPPMPWSPTTVATAMPRLSYGRFTSS